MTEGEYNRRLLERIRKAEAEEIRHKEASEAEGKVLGGCLAGFILLFLGLFKLIFRLLQYWENFTRQKQRKGVIILLFILITISCIGVLLPSSIGGWWILIFSIAVLFILPINIIKALGWLKGIAFTLLSWFVFMAVMVGINILEDKINSKNLVQQSIMQNTLKISAKGSLVNLRQSPNGKVIKQIYAKDFDTITLKKLELNGKWLKVLYFPPNVTDENKAIIGYIHTSLVDTNLSQIKEE